MTTRLGEWDLEGWKEIAAFLGDLHPDTPRKWESDLGMPVDRRRRRVVASSAKLRAWAERTGVVRRAA